MVGADGFCCQYDRWRCVPELLFLPEVRRRNYSISTLPRSLVTPAGHRLQMRCSAPSLGLHAHQRVLRKVGFLNTGGPERLRGRPQFCLCPSECLVLSSFHCESQPSSPASTLCHQKEVCTYFLFTSSLGCVSQNVRSTGC